MHVVAILDRDGSTETKGDQLRLVTETKIDPETEEISLVFEVEDYVKAPATTSRPTSQPTSRPVTRTPPGPAQTIASGSVQLPPGMSSATGTLYVSVRDATGALAFSRRYNDPQFPLAFELKSDNAMFGYDPSRLTETFLVKAQLSKSGDPLVKQAGDMEILQEGIKLGAADLVLRFPQPLSAGQISCVPSPREDDAHS